MCCRLWSTQAIRIGVGVRGQGLGLAEGRGWLAGTEEMIYVLPLPCSWNAIGLAWSSG